MDEFHISHYIPYLKDTGITPSLDLTVGDLSWELLETSDSGESTFEFLHGDWVGTDHRLLKDGVRTHVNYYPRREVVITKILPGGATKELSRKPSPPTI